MFPTRNCPIVIGPGRAYNVWCDGSHIMDRAFGVIKQYGDSLPNVFQWIDKSQWS